jgi:hypothetical protein
VTRTNVISLTFAIRTIRYRNFLVHPSPMDVSIRWRRSVYSAPLPSHNSSDHPNGRPDAPVGLDYSISPRRPARLEIIAV